MIFEYDGVALKSELVMNGRSAEVLLDSGASYTLMSKFDVKQLCNDMNAKQLDSSAPLGSKYFNTASGGKLLARHCVLVNVILAGQQFDLFPCYVRTDNNRGANLIGLDFIMLCDMHVEKMHYVSIDKYPKPSELVTRMFTGTKAKKALVLNSAQCNNMSAEELCSILLLDDSLSAVQSIRRQHSISDADLSKLLLNTVRYYDIHDLKKFNELNDSMHILEKTYHEMFNA